MPNATVSAEPSTRPLSEVARHVVVPTGIVDTLWFEVEQQCREWGDEFDVWQDGLGQLVLGLREDGTFAATIGGVTFSIPRQVAKTFIVGRIVFALCVLFPNLTVLWTAHRIRTATQTFEKLKALARKPGVRQHMMPGLAGGIRSANGEQEFSFANGSRILFGAREQGFGRGFDEVDIEVFDEAQILTEKALEDMVAATNQSRFPHGALLLYMGTPPRPSDPGQVFTERRREALEAKPDDVVYAEHGDAMYVECSADPNVGDEDGPSLDDLEQVAIANPSYPLRTPLVSIKRLRKNLTSDDSWRREGLGVWDAFYAHTAIIPAALWESLEAEGPSSDTPPTAIAVDAAHDGVPVASGCWRVDDQSHVELLGAGELDDEALADWLAEKASHKIPVVIDGASPASRLVPLLQKRRVNVATGTSTAMAKACGGFHSAAVAGLLTWGGPHGYLIGRALAGASKRKIGPAGGWGWDRTDPDVNISPLVAVTLAHYGASNAKKRTGSGRSNGDRRAVSV